jgi:hypothetical protein
LIDSMNALLNSHPALRATDNMVEGLGVRRHCGPCCGVPTGTRILSALNPASHFVTMPGLYIHWPAQWLWNLCSSRRRDFFLVLFLCEGCGYVENFSGFPSARARGRKKAGARHCRAGTSSPLLRSACSRLVSAPSPEAIIASYKQGIDAGTSHHAQENTHAV